MVEVSPMSRYWTAAQQYDIIIHGLDQGSDTRFVWSAVRYSSNFEYNQTLLMNTKKYDNKLLLSIFFFNSQRGNS